jgi:hypothetical protein
LGRRRKQDAEKTQAQMNDFGINIAGLTAVLKARNFYKKPSTDKDRTVVVIQGSGCNPDPAWGRNIEVRTGPKTHEMISSYDLEYVVADGKKIRQIEVKPVDSYVCGTPEPPVSVHPSIPAIPEKPRSVRRKR